MRLPKHPLPFHICGIVVEVRGLYTILWLHSLLINRFIWKAITLRSRNRKAWGRSCKGLLVNFLALHLCELHLACGTGEVLLEVSILCCEWLQACFFLFCFFLCVKILSTSSPEGFYSKISRRFLSTYSKTK